MIATLPLPSADPHPMRRSPEPADPDPNDAAAPSKTQRKRDSHELQHLGEALAALPDERLARLELPEGLADALREYRRTRSHEGRRRQLQYVGKLMRAVDPEPLRDAVAASRLGAAQDTLRLHQAEQWRRRLLADDAALTEWLQLHPATDAAQLRRLLRSARQAAVLPAGERNPRTFRELYQLLRRQLDDVGGDHVVPDDELPDDERGAAPATEPGTP